jgi:hypothetical protein
MLKCNRCGRRSTSNADGKYVGNVVMWIAYADLAYYDGSTNEAGEFPNTQFVACWDCLKYLGEHLHTIFSGLGR